MQPTTNQNQPVQGSQGKWLLPVAIVLGIVVAVIYNIHINAVRAKYQPKEVAIIEIRKEVKPGGKIQKTSMGKKIIPRNALLKGFIRWSQRDRLLTGRGQTSNKRLAVGHVLSWSDLYSFKTDKPSDRIPTGMVGYSLAVNPKKSFGDAINPNDTINIVGFFTLPGENRPKACVVLKDVMVMNIGGVGANTSASKNRYARIYSKMTIAVSSKVALQLANLETHLAEPFICELNSRDSTKTTNPKISDELIPLTKYANPAAFGSKYGQSSNSGSSGDPDQEKRGTLDYSNN